MREKESFYFHLNAARQMEIKIIPPGVSSDNYLIVPKLSFKTPFRRFPAAVCPQANLQCPTLSRRRFVKSTTLAARVWTCTPGAVTGTARYGAVFIV